MSGGVSFLLLLSHVVDLLALFPEMLLRSTQLSFHTWSCDWQWCSPLRGLFVFRSLCGAVGVVSPVSSSNLPLAAYFSTTLALVHRSADLCQSVVTSKLMGC
jgi:hypothetical protein